MPVSDDSRDSRRRPVVGPARGSRDRALGLLVVAAVAAWRPATALASSQAALQVDLRGDRLTVRARQVPLEDALAAIASRLGAEVHGRVGGPRTVDVEFEDVALPDGLARLLGRESFALVYGKAGTLRRIHLLGGPHDIGVAPDADVATAASAPPAPTGAPLQPPPRRLGRPRPAMARADTVYGSSSSRGPQALAAHRGAAMRAMLRAMIADEAFTSSVRAGESPERFLARVGTSGTSETAKANAAAALEDLRRAWAAGQQAGLQP
jgi:hypothetical protein